MHSTIKIEFDENNLSKKNNKSVLTIGLNSVFVCLPADRN